jgi:Phytanoyl-CoA dioxygenase (PhyH)
MFFVHKRRLADRVRQLNENSGREVPVAAVEAIVAAHERPSLFTKILSGILAFESAPSRPGLTAREQQRLNHACDYEGAGRVSEALRLFFADYELGGLAGFDAEFVARCSSELTAHGCALVEGHLPPENCARILEFLGQERLVFREDLSGKEHRGYSARNVERTTSNVCRVTDQSMLLECPDIAALAFDTTLLEIAQRFLGAPPIHTQVACWWSTAYSDELEHVKTAAQQFHQDRDYIKFLKIFVYLTSVDESAGPHEFIAGSNVDYATASKNKRRSSKRLTDEYLRSIYPAERFRKFTAPRGSIILEDTSGFHKGNPLVSGHRLMLQLEFATTLFGNPAHLFRKEALAQVPREVARLDRLVSAYGL